MQRCTLGRWHYNEPCLCKNKQGNVIIINKSSFGPLETYEYGIDIHNKPYVKYQWQEDDYFDDTNYCKNISMDELIIQIDKLLYELDKEGLREWKALYIEIRNKLENR